MKQRANQVDNHPHFISMQEYAGGRRGPLGSLFLPFKHPGSYGIAFQLPYAAADGSQDTCLAWNDRHLSDYLTWHLCSTDTSIAYTLIQPNRSSSHSEKSEVSS